MKWTKVLLAFLCFNSPANAAFIEYHFVGGSGEPEINFTLQIDFSQEGYYLGGTGTIFTFDPPRDTFLVNYASGNYSFAPSGNQFERFYGEDGLTPEGTIGCAYALNSIGLCGTGAVSSWYVGKYVDLTLFDSMTSYYTSVSIDSITPVPLPASIILFLSGLSLLAVYGKNITRRSSSCCARDSA
ncbi:hypothetical protein KAR91_57165 [Candidatus Pacearchaeota archaeon]|nr:hypothetical protein [Candidatus Pacearchaeota archaeon]